MKKFMTVLLVIAVMFTFSFSTAFAAPADTTKVVADRTVAMSKITDAYDDAVAALNLALANAKAGAKNPSDASAADWATACQEAYDEVMVLLNAQLAAAYQAFGLAEQAETVAIVGYEYGVNGSAVANDGYVYIYPAIQNINLAGISHANWTGSAFTGIDASEAMYDRVLAATKAAIAGYNVDKFAADDKVTKAGETKSSYEWAVAAQAEALAYLGAFDDYLTTVTINGTPVLCSVGNVWNVYKVTAAGTEGEAESGSFISALSGLKTTTVATTDAAKIAYAKAAFVANVKAKIEAARTQELDVQNKIIFAQSIATKPNQTAIDNANEEIEKINEKYDALLEVMTYRMDNATYVVEKASATKEYVQAKYNDAYWTGLATSFSAVAEFNSGVLAANRLNDPALTVATLDVDTTEALAIVDLIADLEAEAAALKATVYVDGASAVSVDDALKAAIKKAYMTGAADLTVAQSDTLVHLNAHKLLGTACTQYSVAAASTVKLEGKTYKTLENWVTTGYSTNNTKAVKAIIKEAKAAVKAAATVEEANAAFLAAYAEYDAVPTTADQAKLFAYNGALYKKDVAVKAELEAYIDYKVALMGTTAPDAATAAAIKEFFNIDTTTAYVADADKEDFLEEVVDAASLQAAVDAVKAEVDALKTKEELKAEGKSLVAAASAIVRPVTLAQKDAILGIYDDIAEYEEYCDMVNYTVPTTASKMLVATDIGSLEDLEVAALNAMKKELGLVAKITLEDEEAVKAFADAEDAYDALYGAEGDYAFANGTNYNQSGVYEAKITSLKVTAATNLIKYLPLNATAAQVAEAEAAVDALGFAGICQIDDAWLTKLDKFAKDAAIAEEAEKAAKIASVEGLKIKANSSAKKGSITVKWTVTGDDSNVEKYQVYKSTKAQKGYKKAITTTKTSFKNTKNLKKGTRYYYKVRAFVTVDGVKYYSDWSNKANRIAK